MDSADKQATPGNKKYLLVGLAFVLVIGVAGGWLLLKRHRTATPPEIPKVVTVLHLETFVVNMTDDQRAFLRIGIDLGLAKPAEKSKEAGAGEPTALVRDTVLGVLMAKRADDLVTAEGKLKLKEELLRSLQERAPDLNAREVYFTEFLLQR